MYTSICSIKILCSCARIFWMDNVIINCIIDAHLRKRLPLLRPHLRYEQSSGRHKCSSGRFISEAAQRFGNLCVYKSSALHKKPSNLQSNCATNFTFRKCAKGRHCFFFSCMLYVHVICNYCILPFLIPFHNIYKLHL